MSLAWPQENGLENEMVRILVVIAACRPAADAADGSGSMSTDAGKAGEGAEVEAGDGDDLPDGFLEVRAVIHPQQYVLTRCDLFFIVVVGASI